MHSGIKIKRALITTPLLHSMLTLRALLLELHRRKGSGAHLAAPPPAWRMWEEEEEG